MRSGVRWAVGSALLPAALVGGPVAVTLAWWDRLPASLPNSGGVGDRPMESTIGVGALAGLLLGAALTVWMAGLLALALSRRISGIGGYWLRLGAQVAVNGTAAAAGTVLLMMLGAALDAPTAADVRLGWGYFAALLALPMVAAAAAGLLAYLLAGAPPTATGSGSATRVRTVAGREPAHPAVAPSDSNVAMPAAAMPAAAMPAAAMPAAAMPAAAMSAAADEERLLWWEQRELRPMFWLAGALALTGALMVAVLVPLVGVVGWSGLAPAVSALAVLPFTRYRLVIDGEAVRVAIGPLRRRVPIAAIAAAEPGHLATEDWLLRGMLQGASAPELPLLPGPALALRLTDGSHRLVTCRDVPTAVAMVNTLRARRA
ncbi:hypothetical protein O7626_05945 [Micromonospora sp. WMMD1102]|uniref:hypothetical protein n=1 Tax=Micromonospora sp. WMMD1102 TaxID=3016105 RepID=UPI002415927E|nr:hypothetical protein [Micromonospora sp. WMMD1102]MDG4785479.1 hypothetical protein [Micromonospora sp. WMMD1102]